MKEVLIKIPDKIYCTIKRNRNVVMNDDVFALCDAVINGKVLPEFHGPLADVDELHASFIKRLGIPDDEYFIEAEKAIKAAKPVILETEAPYETGSN